MRTATIQEAKDDLAQLIAAVRSGETILITEDGGAIAELQPVIGSGQVDVESVNEQEDSIAIKAGTAPPPKLERFPPGSVSYGVVDALLEERREGW